MRIAHKLGLLVGTLLAALFVTILVLATSFSSVSAEYNDLLANQVRQNADAREMQVEFKKQVQAFDKILTSTDSPEERNAANADYQAQAVKVRQLVDQLLADTDDAGIRASLQQFKTSRASLGVTYRAAYDAFVAADGTNGIAVAAAIAGQDRWPTDLIDIIVADSTRNTERAIAAQKDAANDRLRVIVVAGALLFVLAAAAAFWVVRGIVRPVRALTGAALAAANDRLPRVVAEIGGLPADAAAPELPPFEATSRDELSELASALTTLQGSAVELALEQRRNELANAETLVNLGRRNQSLLTRTLSYVTELEREERDPEVLGKLFRLDHLATRIRRNAESMLVLAGAEQTRTWTRPVPMEDVLRAALSEIEDYTRVSPQRVDPANVHGSVAADLAHMLAELLENATRFSPQTSQVQVYGRVVPAGYQLDIIDEGLGMGEAELAAANRRIELAGQERTDTKVLGHHVVGRLARRRGIRVRLIPSPHAGVAAQLMVPQSLLGQAAQHAPVADPAEHVAEPVAERVAEPVAGAVEPGPVATVPQRVPAPVAEPVIEPVIEPVAPPVAEPAGAYEPSYEPTFPPAEGGSPPATLPEPRRGPAEQPAPVAAVPAAAATGAAGAPPATGRRVRGANLPDLGTSEAAAALPQRDPAAIGRQLSSLQASVARARHEAAAAQTGDHHTQGSGE